MKSLPALLALTGCVVVIGTRPLHAQSPDTTFLSLDGLLAEVAQDNPTLRAARLDAEALARVPMQVGALPDPSVSLAAFVVPMHMEDGEQRAQWGVEQRVPWPGTLGLRAQSARAAAEATAAEADALALDLMLQVKLAYYALYHVERVEALIHTFGERLGLFSDAALVRYEVGQGTQGAVLQVHLEKVRLSERLLQLKRRADTARQTLARLTNRPGLLRPGNVRLAAPTLPEVDTLLLSVALQNRPEVVSLEKMAARADAEVALARKAFYPDLGFGLTYFDIAFDASHSGSHIDPLAVTATVQVPLQRRRLRARVEEARLRREEVSARQQALQTAIATEVAEHYYAAAREAETVALYHDKLMPQAEATVESILAAYTTGQADYTAFLDAERTRFEIALGHDDAFARYLEATARLERALGTAALPTRDGGTLTGQKAQADSRR